MFPQKKDLQFWEIIVSFRENIKKVRDCISEVGKKELSSYHIDPF